MTAIRGATTVESNDAEEIERAAAELIKVIITKNLLEKNQLCAIIFSCTKDLTAAYPAKGVREILGMSETPMFCTQEQHVEGALTRCIRAIVFCDKNFEGTPSHIYINGAINLRSDLDRD